MSGNVRGRKIQELWSRKREKRDKSRQPSSQRKRERESC